MRWDSRSTWVAMAVVAAVVCVVTPVHAHEEKDPVCGMMVEPESAEHRHDHAGRTYYF